MDISKNVARGQLPAPRDVNHAAEEASFSSHRSSNGDARTKRRLPRRQFARSDSNSDAEVTDRDSGCALEEYTWVPPNLSPDQVIN